MSTDAPSPTSKTEHVLSVRLPSADYAALADRAWSERTTVSALVRAALVALTRHSAPQKPKARAT